MILRGLLLAVGTLGAAAFAAPGAPRTPGLQLPSPAVDADYLHAGAPPPDVVELGRLLFFDKLLSGNRNISCATCHHPSLASADGLALGWGEGGEGVGPARTVGGEGAGSVHGRVPRNAPALFNLGALEFERLFHDGRVESDPEGHYEGGFVTPARWKLPRGLESVLAAQAMFPVGSSVEMAGQPGENEIADAVWAGRMGGPDGGWERLAQRLREEPDYVRLFRTAFPDRIRSPADIRFVDAANAIAAFETVAFRSDRSPFDAFLRGDSTALDTTQRRGMDLFYGKAGCAGCHRGTFQTDHGFHAIAMPQIGPGKGDGHDGRYWGRSGEKAFLEDFGRGRVTGRPADDFRFLTPSLRNVALTGPWGHAGTFTTLEATVRHHLDAVASVEAYRLPESLLPSLTEVWELTGSGSRLDQRPLSSGRTLRFLERDGWVQQDDSLRARMARASELRPVRLSDVEVDALLSFLHALTDPSADALEHWIPEAVPSGLPVDRLERHQAR
ncbi:MAG: cytochrome c peroxidase [Gemmatimonadota bacterium]